MLAFLLTFFSIYGAMNAYVYWRVHAGVPTMGWSGLPLAAWLAIMVAAPLLIHLLGRWRRPALSRALGLVGYLWLAGVFWFCVMGWLLDGWNVGVHLAALAVPGARAALVSRGTGTWGPPLRLGSPPEVALLTLLRRRRAAAAGG